jgi:polysaccharide biosynthesis/export protein
MTRREKGTLANMNHSLINWRTLALVLFCGTLLAWPAAAQFVPANIPPAGLSTRPLEALRQLEGSGDQEYTIGDGDELDIQVVGRPELSGTQLVGPDGKLTLPLAGSFEVRNMTREAAAKGIAEVLQRYYTSLDVTVRVAKYGSNRIFVLGHVAHPGVLYFDNAPTLLEALTKSPGPSVAGESGPSLPQRCAIFRGKDQVVWIDLKTMLDQEGSLLSLRLRRDDVLYIPDQQDELVSVLGEVQHPGMVKLEPKTTLMEVLTRSGGLTVTAGSARIEIVRPKTGTRREVAFKDLLDPSKPTEDKLQAGDVVYVQKGSMAKFEYALQQLAPLSSVLLFSATLLTH